MAAIGAQVRVLLVLVASVVFWTTTSAANADRCENARYESKPRLFVLTDISNEPDDQMSLVRLLTHANELQIEGISAVTSVWKNDSLDLDTIFWVIGGYANVTQNLNSNVPESGVYPSAEAVASRVYAGHPVYGLAALDLEPSNASLALVNATDASSEPLWVSAWGGTNVLAEALNYVQKSRSAEETAAFVEKLRVYSISDQDNAGPWIRANFPSLFYIVSIHAFGEYNQATWLGISSDVDTGGPDASIVSNDWLQEHVRIGPLGSYYPDIAYIMEGDTPSFLGLLQNGLNTPEHPEWGGWGGRYKLVDASGLTGIFGNVADLSEGMDGKTYFSQHTSIWRWRSAFQYDFAARMQWTVNATDANHHPIAIVNNTCGVGALEIQYRYGESITLDASTSYDPDGDDLDFNWFHYREAAQTVTKRDPLISPNVTFTNVDSSGSVVDIMVNSNITAHIILAIEDSRTMSLTSYRRIILRPTA
ncbi:putative cellulose-binding protein [Neofusicoccum parvum UCRNP2]|uniref:Putative cellulose-binding protein n=1 Tax=Botryosphaeria parva (strain UCR-NP2) TaxID=1287680 RepID=R1FW21_BOTPV|nr:putative cellulose-binding protein [Neofusicoccum parvum UCRNP2]